MNMLTHKNNSKILRAIRNAAFAVLCLFVFASPIKAQLNTNQLMHVARNALYFDDYVLSIQYFNMIISTKPHLYEPWFLRGEAKFFLDDFNGCERDCSEAIDRNPFYPNSYELRGLARINLNKYEDAAEDYFKAIEFRPDNRALWHNYVLCLVESKELEKADSICDILIKRWSGQADCYQIKAQVTLQRGDTIKAEEYVDKAIQINKYDFNSLFLKGGIQLYHEDYAAAESTYDRAALVNPKNASVLVNRALARYHQNNYRGAMNDYNYALEIDPRNFSGHYNRGLLLASVGDDNKAIEDFNFIIRIDPNDMMAIFNRGELYLNTGQYKEAVKDYTTVINEYPEFLYGYQQRAKAKRAMGDTKGANKDELYLIQEQMGHKYGYVAHKKKAKPTKTRKKSENNIDDYDKLVEDEDEVAKYENPYRGKVQNRNAEATLLSTLNESSELFSQLHGSEAATLFKDAYKEAQDGNVSEAIEKLTKAVEINDTFAEAYYNRGLLRLLIDDNASAIQDLSKAGELGIVAAYNIIKKNQKKRN